jgi:hypothetical protein
MIVFLVSFLLCHQTLQDTDLSVLHETGQKQGYLGEKENDEEAYNIAEYKDKCT